MADITVATLARCTRLSLRAGAQSAALLSVALGVTLGEAPCRASVSGDRAVLWLGPDEWLLLAPDGAAPGLVAAAEALSDHPAGIVDVSHRSVAIELSGAGAADALNAFCALDLDPRAFPVGMCTRTLFGKAEIVLWRTAAETFRMEVARSFAPYVQACLG